MRVFVKPFYLAMSGRPSALPLFDSMEILGRDITRDRINHAITTLGGCLLYTSPSPRDRG